MISKQHGFDDVKSAEAAYKAAKGKMETLKAQLGIVDDPIESLFKPQSQEQKVSTLKELAARRLEMQQKKEQGHSKMHVRRMQETEL